MTDAELDAMIAELREPYKWPKPCIKAADAIAALREQVAAAEWALLSKGYHKSCDIPACNCGDQWNHGGHAEQRLREFSDALRDADIETNGVTLLKALQTLIARAERAEADNAALRQDAERYRFLRDSELGPWATLRGKNGAQAIDAAIDAALLAGKKP